MSITVTVTDMSCAGCEEIVEGAISDVPGVESVEADRSADVVTVEGDAEVDEIAHAIDFAGYTPEKGSVTEGEETSDESADEPAADTTNEGATDDAVGEDDAEREDEEAAGEGGDPTTEETDESDDSEGDTESEEE